MSNPSLDALGVAIGRAAKRTHASTAMILSARLDNKLRRILEGNMPRLSGRLKKRLFENYGPLNSFSAKIDLAFALGHILEDEYRILHATRDIRNAFAHTNDFNLHFDHEIIVELLAKIPRKKEKGVESAKYFMNTCNECGELLDKHIQSNDLVQALKDRVDSKKALPEK